MRFGRAAAVLLIATAAVAVHPVGVAAQDGADTDAAEVRIAARRVAGERVEFALQQRTPDGDWGVRLSPPRRFFPLRTAEDRWLSSTPLRPAGAAEVRIAARRVAGERVEFALQQRTPDGDWGVRLSPPRRFFPVRTEVGRWLVSAPLTLVAVDVELRSDGSPAAAGPQIDIFEELVSLVLAGANGFRAGLEPLSLDDGLSAAATLRAEAQAASDDWREGFDYGPLLAPDWGFWRAIRSARLGGPLDSPDDARRLGRALLGESASEQFLCESCTHLGVGVATRQGWSYATLVVAAPVPTSAEIAAAEAQMAGLVNDLRESLGLDALAYHSDISAVARRWSQTLATAGEFLHNPNYAQRYPQGWQRAAENIALVTVSTSLSEAVQRSFDNLVDSPGHYATMIDAAYNHVGVGIAVRAGGLWVTQNFARYPAGSP